MAIQLSTARTALDNQLKDITDVSSGVYLQWCQFLSNFVYRNLVAVDPERFISQATLNVTSGTSTYALATLASDFKDIRPFGCGLFEQNGDGVNTDRKLTHTGFGSSNRGFYISGGNIVMTPVPTKNETLIFRYAPNSPTYTDVTDYFTMDGTSTGVVLIPNEYLHYVQQALVALYEVWDEDLGMEAYADARFVRVLDELLRNIKREPEAYAFPDFTQSF